MPKTKKRKHPQGTRPAPPQPKSDIKEYVVVDLFCGAGGSSSGAEDAIEEIGGKMKLKAINHWNTAIATHSRNHPNAEHVIEDVSIVDPETIVEDGTVHLLLASPECKFHSRARGGKPIHDQGRMMAWAIYNWLTKLDVQNVLIENVPEFIDWGPLDENDRPIKAKKGTYFQAWFLNFENLGYRAEWRMLNAADYGDATTRTRFFLQARKDSKPIVWPEPTHTKDDTGMFPGRLPWRGAREIIDWTNPGRSLLDDPKYAKKPLSEKTLRRIAKGLERYGGILAPLYIRLLGLPQAETPQLEPNGKARAFILNRHGDNGSDQRSHSVEEPVPTADTRGAGYLVSPQAEPFHGSDRQHTTPRSTEDPLYTVTTLTGGGLFFVKPEAQPFVQANRNNNSPKSLDEPLPTVTTAPGGGSFIVDPHAKPFLLGQQSQGAPRDTKDPVPTITGDGAISLITPQLAEADDKAFMLAQHSGSAPKSTEEPTPTIMTDGGISLVRPLIIEYYGQSLTSDIDKPLPTVTTCNKQALAVPLLVEYYSGSDAADINLPVPTITTKDRHALVKPTLVDVNHGNGAQGEAGDQSRSQSVDQPVGTITTKRGMGLVDPALVEVNHGNGKEGHKGNDRRVHSVDHPLGAITTSPGMGLVEPILVQTGQTGGNGGYARPTHKPIPTLTTHNDIKVVVPTAEPYIVPNFGEREGQDPRVHDIDEPTPTVTSRGAGSLVSPVLDEIREQNIDPNRLVIINGHPYILDIRFRMLQNKELARAMGFEDEESEYEFVGNISEVTKQIGNAVPVHLAAALVKAILKPDHQDS